MISDNVNILLNDISVISDYFKINRLTLNMVKSKLVHFRKPSVKTGESVQLVFDGTAIDTVSSVTYLGVTFDEHLSWSDHVVSLSNRISSKIGILKKLRFLPVGILKLLYFSLIHSDLAYCTGIWGSTIKSHVNELEVLQRRCCCSVFD